MKQDVKEIDVIAARKVVSEGIIEFSYELENDFLDKNKNKIVVELLLIRHKSAFFCVAATSLKPGTHCVVKNPKIQHWGLQFDGAAAKEIESMLHEWDEAEMVQYLAQNN